MSNTSAFPLKRYKARCYTTHCHVARRNFKFHPSEWTQKAPFSMWFRRFVQFTKLAQQKPILLLWDGHSTHKKNTELTDTECKNNLARLYFPPHCTHRLQPLRVSFMVPVVTTTSERVRDAAYTPWTSDPSTVRNFTT